MSTQSLLSRHPGARLEGYRNSTPRYVKVLAVGPKAEQIIADINDQGSDNVLFSGRLDPHRPLPMDAPVDGTKPHAVILVLQQGALKPFPFLVERTASMLSVVLLEPEGARDEMVESRAMHDIRAIADLFVTTTDRGFVRELVDNLAS